MSILKDSKLWYFFFKRIITMSEIKVNLSLTLPGSIMLSEQECSKNPKKSYSHFSMKVRTSAESNKTETINVSVRKSRTIKQNIKLSKEAYDYMTNKDELPDPKLKKEWGRLTINQRLQYHCKQIAETLGAVDFTFEVLGD